MSSDLKAGDRVELAHMGPDPCPIAPGTKGTVTSVHNGHGFSQISVDWDNGRRLMVVLPDDEIRRLSEQRRRQRREGPLRVIAGRNAGRRVGDK